MKLLGKDISADRLMAELEARLGARGLKGSASEGGPIHFDGLEARVDPVAFNVEALSEHADPTRPLPLETHRTGLGRVVVLLKGAFRAGGQVFINEAFGRQKRFNGHVRDSYAQLSAEVLRLRERLEALEKKKAR
ncbi:MAG: hypothetical protein IPJ65_30365 [Archangiaceae bacterium]|nr:hypothetical protein [Archangiaceae bacterium]